MKFGLDTKKKRLIYLININYEKFHLWIFHVDTNLKRKFQFLFFFRLNTDNNTQAKRKNDKITVSNKFHVYKIAMLFDTKI